MNIKEVYKWGYSLEKDYKLLKEQNNRLNEICIYWENEHDELLEENEHLKNQYESLEKDNKELKFKHRQQAKTIERLINIITDEHYN
jgi:peptidoglycan hydrolase CwlO-like protein